MAEETSNQDHQEMDLDESIDALLSEIDESCARAQEQAKKRGHRSQSVTEIGPGQAIDDSGTPIPIEESGTDDEPEPDPESEAPGEDALDAIDSVSQNAQSLIEEAIDGLLVDDEQSPDSETDDDDLLAAIADELTGAGVKDDPASSDGSESRDSEPGEADAEEADAADSGEATDSDDALDDAIAGLDAELLMGDFEAPDGEIDDSDSDGGEVDAALLLDQLGLEDTPDKPARAPASAGPGAPQAGAEQAEEDDDIDAVAPAQARPSGAGAASPAAGPAKHGADAAEPRAARSPSREDEEIESIWQTAWRLTRVHGHRTAAAARAHAIPLGARLVLTVSRPLKDKPAQLRDSVGYVALWTLFLACVLWVYVIFIRQSPTPTPSRAPSRVVEPGETLDPIREDKPAKP